MNIKNPTYICASVISCTEKEKNIYELIVKAHCELPTPGQFFMLRTKFSSVLLPRPISVYHVQDSIDESSGYRLHFLILKKGRGTEELCSLKAGDIIDMLGPLGKGFSEYADKTKHIALIGAGIGVAPVASFANSLDEKSYDFYACFKTGTYGLEYVSPNNLFISTEDGSNGVQGILSDILTSEDICAKGYDVIYACGPMPMLKYVQKICEKAHIHCFLSLENSMACGVGACLGCTVTTKEGNKRCCKDGPVFEGSLIEFNT